MGFLKLEVVVDEQPLEPGRSHRRVPGHDELPQPCHRIGRHLHDGAERTHTVALRVLEHGDDQVVLAGEVLVEGSGRQPMRSTRFWIVNSPPPDSSTSACRVDEPGTPFLGLGSGTLERPLHRPSSPSQRSAVSSTRAAVTTDHQSSRCPSRSGRSRSPVTDATQERLRTRRPWASFRRARTISFSGGGISFPRRTTLLTGWNAELTLAGLRHIDSGRDDDRRAP